MSVFNSLAAGLTGAAETGKSFIDQDIEQEREMAKQDLIHKYRMDERRYSSEQDMEGRRFTAEQNQEGREYTAGHAKEMAGISHENKMEQIRATNSGKNSKSSAGLVHLLNGQVVKESDIKEMYEQYSMSNSAGDEDAKPLDFMSFRNGVVDPRYRLDVGGGDANVSKGEEEDNSPGIFDQLISKFTGTAEADTTESVDTSDPFKAKLDANRAKSGGATPKDPSVGPKASEQETRSAGYDQATKLLTPGFGWGGVFGSHSNRGGEDARQLAEGANRVLDNWSQLSSEMSEEEQAGILDQIKRIAFMPGADKEVQQKYMQLMGGQ